MRYVQRYAIGINQRTCQFIEESATVLISPTVLLEFDRIITGQAAVAQNYLITKDAIIRRHYAQATW